MTPLPDVRTNNVQCRWYRILLGGIEGLVLVTHGPALGVNRKAQPTLEAILHISI